MAQVLLSGISRATSNFHFHPKFQRHKGKGFLCYYCYLWLLLQFHTEMFFSLEHWILFMAALWGDLWMNTHSCTPLSSNNCVVTILITWQWCFTSFKTSVGSNEVWILKFLKTLGNYLLVVAWHWLKLQNKALWMQCALCRLNVVGGNLFIVNSSILPKKWK